MKFHSDASLADRFTRTPYGPPDYVSAFYYLTDTHPQSPSFCVVPKTMKSRSLEEAHELKDYASQKARNALATWHYMTPYDTV